MSALERAVLTVLLVLSVSEAVLPLAAVTFVSVRLRGTGIERVNREIAVAEGRNPHIPPGAYRLRYWLVAMALSGSAGAIGALFSLRGRNRAAYVVAASLVFPSTVVAIGIYAFMTFAYRAAGGRLSFASTPARL